MDFRTPRVVATPLVVEIEKASRERSRMNPEKPIIEVSPKRLMCPAHGEHFAENWPKGFLHTGITLLQAAVADKRLEDAIRAMGGAREIDDKLNVEYINLITDRRPFCYFVDREVIREALAGSGIGTIGLCRICGMSGMGGPYRIADVMGGGFQKIPHFCFECALNTGENMHRAYPTGGAWHDQSQ